MLSMRSAALVIVLTSFVSGLATFAGAEEAHKAAAVDQPQALGVPAPRKLIEAWNIDVSPDGMNLPEGRGSVAEGRQIFAETCASCHGEDGTDGPMGRLVGGKGTLDTKKPVMTVGSYWPYATTLYDYIHRAMPFDRPQSLTPDQVYAVTAYVLNLNGIVPENTVLDKSALPRIDMPNRNGFEQGDTRSPHGTICMIDCVPLAAGKAKNNDPLRP